MTIFKSWIKVNLEEKEVDLKERKKKIHLENSAKKKSSTQDFFRGKKTTASSTLLNNKILVSKIYLKNKTEGLAS